MFTEMSTIKSNAPGAGNFHYPYRNCRVGSDYQLGEAALLLITLSQPINQLWYQTSWKRRHLIY